MKYQIFIFFITLFIGYSKVEGVSYLHMTPYLDENCTISNGENGVGFAFQIGECFGININHSSNNYRVTLDSTGTNGTISEYSDYDITCSDQKSGQDVSYQVGGCYRAPEYANRDIYVATNYVLISIEINPSIPLYGFRETTYGDSACESDPQYYYYYTNDIVFHNGLNEYSSWYCNNDKPYENLCENSNCKTSSVGGGCIRNFSEWHEKNYFLKSC
ncbi:hypothetical protein ACTFIY_001380 [Dictyostelium cf. discoideum]